MISSLFPFSGFSPIPSISGLAVDRFIREQHERLLRIKRSWEAYEGKLPDTHVVRPEGFDDNTKINISKVIVDTSVSCLFGQDLKFAVNDIDIRTEEDNYLAKFWNFNKKQSFLKKLGVSGAISGHVFVKMVLDEGSPYPRLIILDPSTVMALWDPTDIDRVVEFRIEWAGIDPVIGRPVAFRQTITRTEDGQNEENWQIIDEKAVSEGKFEEIGRDNWPFPWPPIFHCQNLAIPNEFYGMPDISEDIIHLNRAINFIATNINRIIRFHAHPKTWGKGFRQEQLQIGVDDVIIINNVDGTLQNLEMQSDLGSSMEFYMRLLEAIHSVARTPQVATGRTEELGALSGTALRLMYQPLVQKTWDKRLTYGDLLREICSRALEVGGFGADNEIHILWPEIVPIDDMTMAQTMEIQSRLGVSTNTILRKLGYQPEQEMQRKMGEISPPPAAGRTNEQADSEQVQSSNPP
jgi:hypothetical protein